MFLCLNFGGNCKNEEANNNKITKKSHTGLVKKENVCVLGDYVNPCSEGIQCSWKLHHQAIHFYINSECFHWGQRSCYNKEPQ